MQTQYTIIAEPHPAERSVTLLLNGKFEEDAIRDLESSILEARGTHQHVYIDLSEVTLVTVRLSDISPSRRAGT